ncbi:MAG TPA: anhydro-N-acetylmuramic acid kinase [Terriglobales bacterium]|nr:anhydro-N-acetylmuramic acid kinase [Terriglobales bacterium]
MIVAGVMSGTSADGINVALLGIEGPLPHPPRRPYGHDFRVKLLGHAEYPYPRKVRNFILSAMNSTSTAVADLARLNFLLPELYAEAVLQAERRFHRKAELVGCHGQTLYHQGKASVFLGRRLSVTWQSGDGSVLALRLGVPVVSDFRPADMAVGGQGAPLVPLFDFFFYRDSRRGRILQNLGGIANLTAIPPAASPEQVLAFDTGPGNMVIDAVTERLFRRPYDRDGQIAAKGTVLGRIVTQALREPFFRRKPPKTAGREEFGRDFVRAFLGRCGGSSAWDIVATATALTAQSIGHALRRFVVREPGQYRDYIVSGGGTRNSTLMAMLAEQVLSLGLVIGSSEHFGIPSEAKEAAAFAFLAYQTWNHRPSNLPSATGASRPAVLGKISYA